jgi:hypothetical protein
MCVFLHTDNIIEEQRIYETCSKIRRYLDEGVLSEQDELDNPDWVKEIELFHVKKGVLRRDFLPSSKKKTSVHSGTDGRSIFIKSKYYERIPRFVISRTSRFLTYILPDTRQILLAPNVERHQGILQVVRNLCPSKASSDQSLPTSLRNRNCPIQSNRNGFLRPN